MHNSKKPKIPAWMALEVLEYDLDLNPAPETILDIGANIGAFSLHYSQKWPNAHIFAYEPVKANFEELAFLESERIHPICCAIRGENADGYDNIFIGDHGVTCSFHQRGRQTTAKEKVICMSANNCPDADLIKIDTEGCELEIIFALPLDKTRALVVEYHAAADVDKIDVYLTAKGFSQLEHIPHYPGFGVLKYGRINAGVSLPKPPPAPAATSVPAPAANGPARKVYIAVAAHFASNDLMFVQSLLALVARPPLPLAFGFSADPSVERARNILTANFLATDCTHILFIDSDIGFSPADVAQISRHDELVVGGMYPLKSMTPDVTWCGNALDAGQQPGAAERPDSLTPVKYIGTGFLCIARQVFEHIVAVDGPAIEYKQDFPPHRREFAFWRQGVAAGRFLTEDWLFCQRWLELGGKIFADRAVVLKHAGRAEWPLPFQAGNPFVKPERVPANPSPAPRA